jgi:hypothetical protein
MGIRRGLFHCRVIAASGHFLLIAACLAGFLRLRPRVPQWMQFVVGGMLAVGYFASIIITTGPLYVPLLRRVFHIG